MTKRLNIDQLRNIVAQHSAEIAELRARLDAIDAERRREAALLARSATPKY